MKSRDVFQECIYSICAVRGVVLGTASLLAFLPGLSAQQPSNISKPSRLYSEESIWNQAIPANPDIDEDSEAMIEGLIDSIEQHGFVMNLNEWSIPVYRATRDTPLTSVTLAADWAPHTVLKNIPIPSNAQPDPLNDGHMVIIDADGQCHFDLWQARKIGQRWVASWGNALRLSGNGIYERGLGARAAGFGLLAGLIWPEELEQGEINHALVFATGLTREGNPVPPATASDGVTAGSHAIPMGAHLQLDPEFDTSTLPHPFLRTIARALQTYGMYCGDTTGGSVDLYALNPISIAKNPYDAVLPNSSSPFPTLQAIPASAFRVLRVPERLPDHSSEVIPNSCNTFEGEWMNGVRDVDTSDHFAYLADGSQGLRLLNLSNPSIPLPVGSIGTDEPATSVMVSGSHAFVGTAGAGVRIIDISEPSTPKELSEIGETDALSIASTTKAGTTLFVLADDPPLLMAVDISKPDQPRLLSTIEDINTFDTPRDLVAAGDRLYVTDQVTQLQVIDISKPHEITAVTEESEDEFFPNAIEISGEHAYVTDEDTGLLVFDLKAPKRPKLIATLELPDFAFGISIHGKQAFIANGGAGLQVVDISQPENPQHIFNAQPDRGYARAVASDGTSILLASIGGGAIAFQITLENQLQAIGAFENKGDVLIGMAPFGETPPIHPLPSTPPSTPVNPLAGTGLTLLPIRYSELDGFTLQIEGPEGETVQIEISEDLESWEILAEVTLTSGHLQFTDDEASEEPVTFYRLTSKLSSSHQ